MTATTVREVETKLAADDAFTLPDLALSGLPGATRQKTVVLTAAYYDTEDLRLARSKVTLRRRTGGGDAGWHLKLLADDLAPGARDELQLPLGAGRPGKVPLELAELVLGITRGAPLTPRATMRTRRTPLLLSDRTGAAALEVVDDRVTVTEGPAAGLSYREIEVEAVGDDRFLPTVVDLLVEAGATPGGFASKGARALGVDSSAPPLVPAPPEAGPGDPAWLAVQAHLRTHVSALLRQDTRVRRDLPDAVHQFRVAARRLRSGLQAFAPLVEDQWARWLRGELGWAAGVLGASRDTEVLEERLLQAVRALPADLDRAAGLVAVQDHLEAGLAAAAEEAREAMTSPRYLTLLDELVAAAETPRTTELAERPAREVLPPLVDKRWRKLRKAADRLPDEIDGHDDHWHEARIDAKKARYAAEACVPVFGKPAKQLARQLTRVTELLGEHQDCAIAAETVHGLLDRDTGPQTSFTLGALYAQQRHRAQQLRHEFIDIWPEVRQPSWRAWLKRPEKARNGT